jgi:hypothetical protein
MPVESYKGSDRRRYERHELEVGNVVGFSHGGLDYEGIIVDISMGGLRIRMTERAPLIEGDFTLMHDLAGPLQAKQSWSRGTSMGVEFHMAEDSELSRSLRCVQILLDGDGKGADDGDAADAAEEARQQVRTKASAFG